MNENHHRHSSKLAMNMDVIKEEEIYDFLPEHVSADTKDCGTMTSICKEEAFLSHEIKGQKSHVVSADTKDCGTMTSICKEEPSLSRGIKGEKSHVRQCNGHGSTSTIQPSMPSQQRIPLKIKEEDMYDSPPKYLYRKKEEESQTETSDVKEEALDMTWETVYMTPTGLEETSNMASAEVNCPLQLMRSVKEETEEFTFPDSPSQLNVKEEARQFPGSPPQLRSVKEDSEEILRSLYSLRRVSVVLVDCCRPQGRQKNNEENHRDAEARKRSDENQTAHTSSDQHQCPTCGKGFAEKSKLIAHQRIHYHCTTCGKGFAQKSHLIRHQCVHAARENPSLCSTYGAAFFRTTSLADHQRTHTGESPYQCTTCGKGFTLKCNLITHQRTHTGPYQCATCGKSFKLKEAFNKHQKKHIDKSHWSTRRRGLF